MRGSWAVCFMLFLVAGLVVTYQIVDEYFLYAFCQEDCLVEWATVVFYLFAAYLLIFKGQGWKNPWKLLLGLLFVLIAGEEISWGQRLFHFHAPVGWRRLNAQREFNLHNMPGFQETVRAAGLLVYSALCFIIPLTNRLSARCRRLYAKRRIPVFPPIAVVTVVLGMLLMAVPRLFFGEKIFNLDEIGELYLALAMFFFALSGMNDGKRVQK